MRNPSDRLFHNRIFSISAAPEVELWFFVAREGNFGPFISYGEALRGVVNYVRYCQENGLAGGRLERAA